MAELERDRGIILDEHILYLYLSVDVIVVLWQSIAISIESGMLTIHGGRAGRAGRGSRPIRAILPRMELIVSLLRQTAMLL